MKKMIFLALASSLLLPYCKKENKMATATISTNTVTGLTSVSAQTGGNITSDGGSSITKRGVCWASHANPSLSDSITENGTGSGLFSVTLTNLSANTTYYIKAYAINSTGTSYGNEISFTTNAGMATLTTTAATNIQALSATSGGNVTNDGGAPVTERGIVYATTANPTTSNFKIVAGAGTGTFTASLTPLASQQTYYVRAYATNSYGTSYGNQVQFNAASANTITDVDGNVYPYITVCGKDWTATNLKTTHYKNGDTIIRAYAIPNFNWSTASQGVVAYPNNDQAKVDSFGLLYNLYAINDNRGVCPTGWHVPTDAEWKALEMCQGMIQADADARSRYRGTIAPSLREGGSSGLNLRLGGYLLPADGTDYSFGTGGFFYTSTVATATGNYYRSITGPSDANQAGVYRSYNGYAMSVRCTRD